MNSTTKPTLHAVEPNSNIDIDKTVNMYVSITANKQHFIKIIQNLIFTLIDTRKRMPRTILVE